MMSLCAPLWATRSWWNSWWIIYFFPRCSGLWTRTSTFQFLIVQGESMVFKVFPPSRVQQSRSFPRNAFLSGLCSRSLTPLSLEEVFKVFSQVRVHLRLRTVQLEFLKTQMSLVYGFFAELPREVSSWTPAAYGVRHRRYAGRLHIPPGPGGCGFIKPLVGSESPSRGRGHFAADASVTFSVRTGLDGFMEGYDIEAVGRGEGLGIPSPFLGCHFWQACSVSSYCLRRTVLDSSCSVLCALLGLTADTAHVSLAGAFGCYFTHFRVKGGLSDPGVDPRPCDCKLWSLRSCSPSLVVDIPVMAHRQIPMVLFS